MTLKEKMANEWRKENAYITPTGQNVKDAFQAGWDACADHLKELSKNSDTANIFNGEHGYRMKTDLPSWIDKVKSVVD